MHQLKILDLAGQPVDDQGSGVAVTAAAAASCVWSEPCAMNMHDVTKLNPQQLTIDAHHRSSLQFVVAEGKHDLLKLQRPCLQLERSATIIVLNYKT